jgi:hypothetical protein
LANRLLQYWHHSKNVTVTFGFGGIFQDFTAYGASLIYLI